MANEQTSVPLYAASEVLTAANMNISAGTGVPVFATTVTRDAAFGGASEKVLAEGQLCYLSSTNVVQQYNGSGWETVGPTTSKIAQVLQATTATEVTTTSTSYVTTGLSLAITPTLNTSKILILTTMPVQTTVVAQNGNFTIFRGTVAGTNLATAVGFGVAYNDDTLNMSFAANFLDSPATTSATTYTVGMKTSNASNTVKAQVGSSTSTLTLIEVLA